MNLLIQAKREAMITGSNLRIRSLKSEINNILLLLTNLLVLVLSCTL